MLQPTVMAQWHTLIMEAERLTTITNFVMIHLVSLLITLYEILSE
ncbi:MAG: hypothetical protein R3E08_09960 [Thiotrichaceae bacterium]